MKRAALTHPKMYALAASLGVSRATAIGHVSLLIDFTAEFTPRGDIGRWDDGAIARACDWSGDPGVFVESMRTSGWIDADPRCRYLVHDWPDHCENWVKAKLVKLKDTFIQAQLNPTPERSETVPESALNPTSERSEPQPESALKSTSEATSFLAKPSQAKPRLRKGAAAAASFDLPESINMEPLASLWVDWQVDRRERGKSLTARAAKMQIDELSAMGVDRGAAALRHSIKNGYTGIFEPGANGTGKKKIAFTAGDFDGNE